jgi:hypothetical protein
MNRNAILKQNNTYSPIEIPSEKRGQLVLVWVSLFIVGFIFSHWFLTVYSEGDQRYYENFWIAVGSSYPYQWQQLQISYVGSSDLLYSGIIGLGAYNDFDRIAYLSAWNGLLISAIGHVLWKNKSSLIFSLFVFSNFYILVLLGPAERLKFAYLFLILSLCINNRILKATVASLSVLCHTQAVVQLAASGIYYVLTNHRKIFANERNVIIAIVIAPFAVGFGYYLYTSASLYDIYLGFADIVSRKSEIHSDESQGILEIVQWGLVLGTGLLVFNKKVQFLISMIPLGVLTSLYGNRINVATLAFFCALAIVQRKTSHPFVLAVMGYMSFKSIGFIMRVLDTGQGFL